jgi:exonuclease SbcD
MRFLHTSDWHLGRSLHRADLREAQARFLDHLVATARDEQVDAVLVAGDIYDRAIPPVDSVALYDDVLARLSAARVRVVLISGNHDSASRLGVNSALIDAAGVHLRTRPAKLAEPVMLHDDDGPVAVYGIPYLEPAVGLPDTCAADHSQANGDDHATSPAPGSAGAWPTHSGHAAILGAATARIRTDVATKGMHRTVVMAHAWVAGGADDAERAEIASRQQSSSERDISVGGIGYVPASLFAGFGYVALGHLHGRQTLADNIRYSGSPLPYSFSEARHTKGSWLVEVGGDGNATADWVPAPVHKRLSVLTGQLDDVLSARDYADREADFVAVTLTDTVRPENAMDRLRRRFPYILTLDFKPAGVTEDLRSYRERVHGRDDLAVAAEFVKHVRNSAATDAEQNLLKSAFAAVSTDPAASQDAGQAAGSAPLTAS